MTEARWQRGDEVVWRSRPDGTIGYVFAAIVVEDSEDVIALFQPAGAPCKRRTGARGGPGGRVMLPQGWDGGHEDVTFAGPSTLRMQPTGMSYAVLRPWLGEDWGGWYVNLEQSWRRTPVGVDGHDDILDILVADDLSAWKWKDEDELAWSVDVGKVSAQEAATVRATGEAVIAAVQQRQWPFDSAAWSRWQPDPAWPVPTMPADWNVPIDPPPSSLSFTSTP